MKLHQKGFTLVEGLLIVIALTMVVGVGYYVVNANKEEPNEPAQVSQSEKKEEPKPETQQKAPEIIEYDPEITIQSTQDIVKLEGASDSFKSYIRSLTTNTPQFPGEGCEYPNTISVKKIVKDTFATGGIGACGGARYVWKKKNNEWKSVLAGQQAPNCSEVLAESIPRSIIEYCFDENNPSADQNGQVLNPTN